MSTKSVLGWSSALCLGVTSLGAQETNVLDRLQSQLLELQQNIEKQRLQAQMLQKEIEALQAQRTGVAETPAKEKKETPPASPLTAPAAAPERVPAATATPEWSATQPIRIGSAQNYINLSFDALAAAGWSTADDIESLQQGDHDPHQRGFTVQNLEAIFEGLVDPYFRALANIVLKIDTHGDTTVEAEEAYLETLSLPLNLQVKAGQFFTEFGRINPTHPHTWDFVDSPLVLNRFMGPDGLRNPGARLSWLVPTPFYSELFMTVQDSQGETAFSFRNDNDGEPLFGRPVTQRSVSSLGDMLYALRYAASFNLSDSQTLLGGLSAAFGPNGTGGDTQIYGADVFWKWKPVNHHAGFPYVTWQTEAMFRQFHADAYAGDSLVNPVIPALPSETLTDYGFYSQVSYGFKKGWVASLRGDFTDKTNPGEYESLVGLDPERDERWRISPALTWYPSEFSKIRLQYNYDDRAHEGTDHSVWMQFEFLLGTHAAHKF